MDLIDFYQNNFDSGDTRISGRISSIRLPMKIKVIKIGKSRESNARKKLKTIPLPIKALYPGMSYATYAIKIKDPLFLYDSVKICSECYGFIRNVQDIKELYQPAENTDRRNNSDLKMIKSIQKEKSIRSILLEEKSKEDDLYEQGMMISKKSGGSSLDINAEELKIAYNSQKQRMPKVRSKSGLPKPGHQWNG